MNKKFLALIFLVIVVIIYTVFKIQLVPRDDSKGTIQNTSNTELIGSSHENVQDNVNAEVEKHKKEIQIVETVQDTNQPINITNYYMDLDLNGTKDYLKIYRKTNDIIMNINEEDVLIDNIYGDNIISGPHINIVNKQYPFISCEYETNNGTDGYYKGSVIAYKDDKLATIWSSNLNYEELSIYFKDDLMSVDLNKSKFNYKISSVSRENTKQILSDKTNYDKLNQNQENIRLYETENLSYVHSDKDITPYIVVQNPIYFHKEYAYISSLYSIWTFENNQANLRKIFVLDRYSNEASIIRELISKEYLTSDYINSEREDSFNNLINQNILKQNKDRIIFDY